MGLFDKKDKYNIKEEDNVPQSVYGTPDSMRKENQNNKEKYDINVEDNMPQIVYGIPDFMKNDDFFKKDSQESKYDVQPEDNMPREVYGIPDFMLEDRKNKVFEAFVGGYFGPSSFYYINKVNEEYEFRYGFSQSGAKIFNNPNNKDLHIIKHNKQFYEDFKNNLIQLTKDWSKQGYYDNQIMDGTQWNIDIDVENAITYSGSNAFPDNFNKVMNYIDEIFETKKSNDLNKYDIDPTQNNPQRVYGVPNPDKLNNLNKYEIDPKQNVPQKVYGIPNTEKFVLPKVDLKTLKINIKNKESNYVLMFSCSSKGKIDLTFGDLNKLENKSISDISTDIPKKYYDAFIEKYNKITSNWKESYIGEKNVNWSITEKLDKSRIITGNGDYPDNWNEFIDLLVEYEILFKKKKNVDVDIINDMKYDKLTFDEAVKSKVKDPFFSNMIIKYFKEEKKVTDIVAKIIFKDLMKYDDILNEFTKCLSQKTYDLKDAIEINGYTAKQISELNPNFGVCGVYTFMKTLRDDKENAEKMIKSGFPNKDVVPPVINENNNDSEKDMVEKYRKEIEEEVDTEMIGLGLLTVKDGRKIPVFGGGQDSKIILLDNGIVKDYAMNTLCAAGTGAFLSSQAKRLDIDIEKFGDLALESKNPVKIAARCTVFAESDLIHKAQIGYEKKDIVAGLCKSIVLNYLNNVGKGKKIYEPIVFQGGVSKNKGVVKYFEEVLGKKVITLENGHLMGALGVAILSKNNKTDRIYNLDIEDIKFKTKGIECQGCSNHCEILKIYKNDQLIDTWGNRCEKTTTFN